MVTGYALDVIEIPVSARLPVRVAVVNDVELVVQGLASMLANHEDKVRVVQTVVGGVPDEPVDIALFDTFTAKIDGRRTEYMTDSHHTRNVVLYSWNVARLLRAAERNVPVSFVSKSCDTDALVAALLRASTGDRVIELGLEQVDSADKLSTRESEILALIANGLTNNEIANVMHLSTETIKTYAERAYQKIGVRNRTQAAVHATQMGLVRSLAG